MKKISLAVALLSVFVAVLPLVSVLVAGGLATVFNCNLNEGSVSSCPTPFGDLGSVLYTMGVFGWFLFFTVPIGFVGLVIALIILLVAVVAGRRTAPQQPPQS